MINLGFLPKGDFWATAQGRESEQNAVVSLSWQEKVCRMERLKWLNVQSTLDVSEGMGLLRESAP